MNRGSGIRAGAAALCGALAMLIGCGAPPAPVAELSGPTMGTRYSVQLSPPPEEAAGRMLQLRIDERLRQINALLSTYDPESALMRFNRSTSTDWQPVPEPLASLVQRAAQISALTGGRYDVTVGPLVNLWGFGSDGARDAPPPADAIAQARSLVGYQNLSSRLDPPALRKTVPGLAVDLSSIAKGWAVDELARLLEAQGHRDFLIEIGGEIVARGAKADGTPWRIAIERPDRAVRSAAGGIVARDVAIATSGDYRNFFVHQGQRYAHTIDPASGRPLRHRLAAVTVLADNCTDADAWATALYALGESAGPALADRQGLAALFLVHAGDDFTAIESAALARRGLWEATP